MDFMEMGCEGMYWIYLAEDQDLWQVLNMVLKYLNSDSDALFTHYEIH
jgi:hypothetical protein